MSALAAWRQRIERLFEWISIALLVLLALEVLVGIVFRAAGRPLSWYDEVASVLLAWLTYYASALAALRRSHIGFPGLANALRPAGRMLVLSVRELCIFGFFGLLAYEGWKVLGVLAGDTLVTVEIPVPLTQSVIPFGAALFVAAEALNLPGQIAWARRKEAAPSDVAKELSH